MTSTYAGSREGAWQLATETGSTSVLTERAERNSVLAQVRDSGPIDVLVVNAGIVVLGNPLEMDPDAVDRLFRVNIHAPYRASVAAAR